MTKTKNTDTHIPLVITGYVLFGLLVIAVLLTTTIPFGRMLLDSRTLHNNVAVFAIALTVGALLPAFLGYIVGDNSTKTKSRVSHHFNGVLFGLLAYWIMMLPGGLDIIPPELLAGQPNTRIILINTLPSVAVVLITASLAVAHAHSRQLRRDILDYKPFSALLIACVVAFSLLPLINGIATGSIGVYSFMSMVLTATFGLLSYVTLRKSKLNAYSKVAWSAVSVSVLFVTMFILFQFVSGVSYYILPRATMEEQQIVSSVAYGLSLIGWIAYWVIQTKLLSSKS